MTSRLLNPLATIAQLEGRYALAGYEDDVWDSVYVATQMMTQMAGLLLELPPSVTAKACVLLGRFWMVLPMKQYEYSDISATMIYLVCKEQGTERSLHSILTIYAYLQSSQSPLTLRPIDDNTTTKPHDEPSQPFSATPNAQMRHHILHLEPIVLASLGFDTHVALPHPLAITYLQSLDFFEAPDRTGLAQRVVAYLNSALLCPQLVYLTHQPHEIATAAMYLALRDGNVATADVAWWEIFDVDREVLGFLAVVLNSLESWMRDQQTRQQGRLWPERGVLTREHVRRYRKSLGGHSPTVCDDNV